MTSIPTNNYNNFYADPRFRYLERLDVSPEIHDAKVSAEAKKYLLRRSRYTGKSSKSDMLKSLAGSVAGTLIPLAFMMKKQGVKNPFKVKYGLGDMLILSGAPIIGGVACAMIGNDAKTNKAKRNEGVFQFFNAAIPTWIAGATLQLCENNKKLNNIPMKVFSILASVLIGMHGAASVSNLICDPKDKDPDRKLTLRDSIANVDDLVGVLVLAKFPLADKLHVEKLLPFIYAYCGFRAGKSN